MKKEQIKQKADKLLKDNPSEKAVFITEDGQAFFSENLAGNHARTRKLEVFPFYQGGVPVDEDLEALLQEYQENERAYQENERKVSSLARMEEGVELGDEEDPVVMDVAKLRAIYEESETKLQDTVAENTELSKELDAAKKQADELSAKLAASEKETERLNKELAKLKKEAK